MITLKFPIQLLDEDKELIIRLQKQQSPMIRSAYSLAKQDKDEKGIREVLKSRFSDNELDSWFEQSSVKSGIGMFKADTELGVESRIFGGKENFIRRAKGLITNEEYKKKRLLPLYLIGEAPAKGNRKFEFNKDSIVFKPFKGTKVHISIPRLRKNWDRMYQNLVVMSSQKQLPVTVSLTTEYIALSFDEKKGKKVPPPVKNRYAGIDINPNNIGVSIFDSDKLISTKLFTLYELTGKNSNENKLMHETREIGHSIGNWLQQNKVDKVFIEDLKFTNVDRKLGKNFNRLTINKWKRKSLFGVLSKYYKLYTINAAYTSTIGNILNPDLPDAVAASTAISKRGYEIVIMKSKKFYPELPLITGLQDRWKETEFPEFSNWIELHDFIKNMGLKYRVPLPSVESFRVFKSSKSKVYITNDYVHK